MGEGEGEGEGTLEFTPTWVVVIVCAIIVILSLTAEKSIHFADKRLLKIEHKEFLNRVFQKVKEELMMLGLMSLLILVLQAANFSGLCVPKHLANEWLPCKKKHGHNGHYESHAITSHHRLSEAADFTYCHKQGKVPVLSVEALHHVHMFIFTLAVVHVMLCFVFYSVGTIKMSKWKSWEISILRTDHELRLVPMYDPSVSNPTAVRCTLHACVRALRKHLYRSVSESDYITMRSKFIRPPADVEDVAPPFNFYGEFLVPAFEADFKKVVGIRWFHWLFLVLFLILNVHGYHAYFWIVLIPVILLLGLGTSLQLSAQKIIQTTSFRNCLILIHIIFVINSFEIAHIIWIRVVFGVDSCIADSIRYTVARLVIVVFVQLFCSYATLPLYAFLEAAFKCDQIRYED